MNSFPIKGPDSTVSADERRAEAERQVLDRGDVQLKPKRPGSADDPEARLHLDGESDAAEDDLNIDTDSLPVFGTDSNR